MNISYIPFRLLLFFSFQLVSETNQTVALFFVFFLTVSKSIVFFCNLFCLFYVFFITCDSNV
eukprot:UN00143